MASTKSASSSEKASPSPTSITLAPYSLRYHRRGRRGDLSFNDPDTGDLFDTLYKCLQALKARHRDHEDDQEIIKLDRLESNRQDRWLEGRLEVGAYGWEAELRKVDTYKRQYERQMEDAEVLPFYFLLHLPRRDSHGVLILQRFGPHGVKTAFERELSACLRQKDLTLDLDPLVPEAFVERLKDTERVRKVRLIRTELPSDIAEAFQLGGVKDVTSELVLRIGGDVESLPEKFLKLVRGGKHAGGYAAVEEAFPHQRMKIEVEVDGRTRTLDVEAPGRITAFHDVTKKVVPEGKEGSHPTWESIRCEGFKLLRAIHQSTYSLRGRQVPPGRTQPPPLPDVCAQLAERQEEAVAAPAGPEEEAA